MIPEASSAAVRTAHPQDMPILAAAIGDSPETVISHYLLTSRTCDAWYVGDVHQPRALIIQAHSFPAEPVIHGFAADDIARIIPHLEQWDTFSTPLHLATSLERPVARARNTGALNTLIDVYHVHDGQIPGVERSPDVRLLTDEDALVIMGIEQLDQSSAYKPLVAAAVIDGEAVSIAHTFAWSPMYVDIGVTTHEQFRNKGYATTAAALLIEEVQKRGRTPVWSCGITNEASMRIAEKLGFRETSRRIYLIPLIPETDASS